MCERCDGQLMLDLGDLLPESLVAWLGKEERVYNAKNETNRGTHSGDSGKTPGSRSPETD